MLKVGEKNMEKVILLSGFLKFHGTVLKIVYQCYSDAFSWKNLCSTNSVQMSYVILAYFSLFPLFVAVSECIYIYF